MAPSSPSLFAVTLLLLLSTTAPSDSQTCSSQTFPTRNELFAHCNDLPTLASHIHWTYSRANSTLSLAFVAAHPESGGWISWAINPTGAGMIGAQSLVAFKDSKGAMTVRTYNVTSYASVRESNLWFRVKEAAAESSGGVMRLFATVVLPEMDTSTIHHVWQVGPSVTGGVPDRHALQPANLNSKGTLDLLKGESSSSTSGIEAGGDSRLKKKNIHGMLNAVSWGVLFPTGIMIARYMRTFKSADPAWFHLHIACQASAYSIGVAGWATGLKLGSSSKGVQHHDHRSIGIALFCLLTLQMFALLVRPEKEHMYRMYWNIYHHGVGYAVLVLGIFNVFEGLRILSPASWWKSAYITVVAALGVVALALEVMTWTVVLGRRSKKSTSKP